MIKSKINCGVDVIDIDRIERLMSRRNTLKKILTLDEISILNKLEHPIYFVAGRIAAKEAVAKCLGTGFKKFGFKDIEILKKENGSPFVNLLGNAKRVAQTKGDYEISISISHSKKTVVAFAIIQFI